MPLKTVIVISDEKFTTILPYLNNLKTRKTFMVKNQWKSEFVLLVLKRKIIRVYGVETNTKTILKPDAPITV